MADLSSPLGRGFALFHGPRIGLDSPACITLFQVTD